jgi:serine/threonine protein kinase
VIPGTLLAGRYQLRRVLGAGGMARVYEAWDKELARRVAVKVLDERSMGDPKFVARFGREARNAASLSSPNVVRVFDAGVGKDAIPYIAMELVDGGTLKERIVNGPLAPEEAAQVALDVTRALEEAHEKGIVHRDVKPENVLLGDHAGAKVADFGISRAEGAEATTHTDTVLGSVAYVSPEQAAGLAAGPASDLYSLGVVLYEMLAARPPFDAGGGGPIAVAMKHLGAEPAPPSYLEPSVPRDLELVTLRLLAKRPEERYTSASALAADLVRFLEGAPLSATDPYVLSPPAPPEPLPQPATQEHRRARRPLRRRVLAVALAFALLAPVAILAVDSSADGRSVLSLARSLTGITRLPPLSGRSEAHHASHDQVTTHAQPTAVSDGRGATTTAAPTRTNVSAFAGASEDTHVDAPVQHFVQGALVSPAGGHETGKPPPKPTAAQNPNANAAGEQTFAEGQVQGQGPGSSGTGPSGTESQDLGVEPPEAPSVVVRELRPTGHDSGTPESAGP